jgi:hypothetical protein
MKLEEIHMSFASGKLSNKQFKDELVNIGEVHPDSPSRGDIVECTNVKCKFNDPSGYIVEVIGTKSAHGQPFGTFAARGKAWGGLYQFNVLEFKIKA